MFFLNNAQFPPLLFATLSLIASISAAFFGVGLIFLTCALGLTCAAWWFRALQPFTLALMLASAVCGQLRYAARTDQFKQFYVLTADKPCTILATVYAQERVEHVPLKQLLKISTQKITPEQGHETLEQPFNIHLYIHESADVMVGDQIVIENLRIKSNKKESFCRYLAKENIAALVFAPHAEITVMHRPTWSMRRSLDQYKKSLFSLLKRKMQPTTFSLFSSLFLGKVEKKQQENSEIKKQCAAWGISHYLARSGLHLVIFILFWQLISKFIPIHLFYKNIFIMLLIGFYALLTSSSISFYRAFLSLFFAKLFSLSLIGTSTLQILCLVCFIVLMYNPLYLFFLDFQLSFLLTFGLILHNHLQIYKKELIA